MRATVLILFMLCILTEEATAASILIIESYHKEFAWDESYNRGIKSVVDNDHTFSHFYMNTKILPSEQFADMASLAWQAYLKLKPDLVVLCDDNAIKLLAYKFGQTKVPVVFLGLNANPRDYGLTKLLNFTGVLERPIFKRSIILADQILPKKSNKKILVVFDNSQTSKASIEPISRNFKSINIGKVKVDFQLIDDFVKWQQVINNAKESGYDALFIGLYHTLVDAEKQHVSPNEVILWTQKHAPLPHFGFWNFSIGARGNVGGYVLDGYLHGQLAGKLISKILKGENPNDLAYEFDRQGRYLFSLEGLKRWRLELPKKVNAQSHWTN
ncbi:ABC transporter substrate-binding protein [Shewanella violacea]|uniref:ABC-type sugar transport system, ATPase component n=1 Tax=Shewanella violacea (strain JCM 10179 / CIP 106290 / LMG 19151 / DSS12) TaxID=637905 RepID=D4ZE45_SHEVD|nr:ABC transporter substrate binding protein [Shewanella violacea]BAJ04106.1 conserved hypothetical protein [Shewanella violacea DSS12]